MLAQCGWLPSLLIEPLATTWPQGLPSEEDLLAVAAQVDGVVGW